jgi:hypothetical protein
MAHRAFVDAAHPDATQDAIHCDAQARRDFSLGVGAVGSGREHRRITTTNACADRDGIARDARRARLDSDHEFRVETGRSRECTTIQQRFLLNDRNAGTREASLRFTLGATHQPIGAPSPERKQGRARRLRSDEPGRTIADLPAVFARQAELDRKLERTGAHASREAIGKCGRRGGGRAWFWRSSGRQRGRARASAHCRRCGERQENAEKPGRCPGQARAP